MSSGGSACSFAPAERFARHGELTPCVPFPRCCLFVCAGGPGQGPGVSPAGLAGAAGVLGRGGPRADNPGGGEGSRRGWACVFGCGGPMAGLRPGRPAGLHTSLRGSPACLPGCMGRLRGWPGGVNHAGARAAGPAAAGARRGQYVARPRARPRARSRSCGLSRPVGAADVPVAHAVEDQGEQLAGGGDLGGVLGLGAAAGDDGVLDLPRPRAGGLPLDRLAH